MKVNHPGQPVSFPKDSNSPNKTRNIDFSTALNQLKAASIGSLKGIKQTSPEIQDLAKAVAAGKLSKESAGRKFIGIMVNQYFDGKIGEKGHKIIEDSLASVLANDPHFSNNTVNALKKNVK